MPYARFDNKDGRFTTELLVEENGAICPLTCKQSKRCSMRGIVITVISLSLLIQTRFPNTNEKHDRK